MEKKPKSNPAPTIRTALAGIEVLGRYALQLGMEQEVIARRVGRIEKKLRNCGKVRWVKESD